MASRRKRGAKAVSLHPVDLANITKANPYLQRLIEDATLRDNVRTALDSGKHAYDRLIDARAPHKALLDDRKLQTDLRSAAEAVRDAALALSDAPNNPSPRKARKGGIGRKLAVVAIGAVAALAGSESLRSKVLDALFGAEEEFQYTPPVDAAPAAPEATPVTAA
jgi:hypothetical protein